MMRAATVAKRLFALNTWFDMEEDDGIVFLSSWVNGSALLKRPGQIDINEARRLVAALTDSFPAAKIDSHVVNERVYITIHEGTPSD